MSCTATWDPDGDGPERPVLVVGGVFTIAGSTRANNVAFWDGYVWHALGDGLDGRVSALAVFRGEVIAAGEFLHSASNELLRIARWNGSQWEPLGFGLNRTVHALAVFRGDLIAAGDFDFAGVPVALAARWDGVAWHRLGSTSYRHYSGHIYSLAVVRDLLYLGGRFSIDEVGNGAIWDGTILTQLSARPLGEIHALINFRDELIANGETFGGAERHQYKLARWDGFQWRSLGNGFGGRAYAMTVINDTLVVGGEYNLPNRGLGVWNGTDWKPHCPKAIGQVYALYTFNGQLLANASFSWPGIYWAGGLLRWTGETWQPFSSAINGEVTALFACNDSLAFGGYFDQAGGGFVSGITRWNGSAWSSTAPLPGVGPSDNSRIAGFPSAFTAYDGRLVAAGSFRTWELPSADRVVIEDGADWVVLGAAFDDRVTAMTVHENQLVVGGSFTSSVDEAAPTVARWNGSIWQPVGRLLADTYARADALASFAGDLYVGGYVVPAGGEPIYGLSRWDGEKWDTPGGGVDGAVNALLADHDNLIVGGYFTTAGGVPVNCIARWDGRDWHGYGNGTNATVLALAMHEGHLYIGGYFTYAGSQPASYVAMWDGSDWQPLGTGVLDSDEYGGVYALASFRGDLIVGGRFLTAGGMISRSWARWGVTGPLPLISAQPEGRLARTGERIQLRVEADAVSTLAFQWRKNGTPVGDDVHIGGSMGNTLTIDPVGLGDQGTYDVVVSGACGSTTSERAPLRVFASVPGQPVLTPAQPASAN